MATNARISQAAVEALLNDATIRIKKRA